VKALEGTLRRIATALLTVSLIVICALVSVHLVALNLGFYRQKWVEFGVTEDTRMSLESLSLAGRALTDYFTGKSATPQVTVPIEGQERPLYNQTELTHLVDVKTLFAAGITLEQVLAAEVLGIALYLNRAGYKRALSRSFLMAGLVTLGILVALAVPATMNFTGFWTNFHLLTFTNDLWILDPNTDWLIKMFPEDFFLSAVTRVGVISSGISILYILSGLLVRNLSADNRH
jgi:integral membrane protein (TIGR01906 family)